MGDLFTELIFIAKKLRMKNRLLFITAAIISITHINAQTPWNGTVDTDWYASYPDAMEYTITTAEQLAGLAQLVNDGTATFEGKVITQLGNILLNDTTGWNTRITSAHWIQPENAAPDAPADSLVVAEFDTTGQTYHQWIPIGQGYITNFKGTFDGRGYSIDGLYINGDQTLIALFGTAGQGSVFKNIHIGKAFLKANNPLERVTLGGLVAQAASEIEHCSSAALITSIAPSSTIGGLVGIIDNGSITDSYATGDIAFSGFTSATIGGLVADGAFVEINYGNATGDIAVFLRKGEEISNVMIGAFAGKLLTEAYIRDSYATGKITASTYGDYTLDIGGLVGYTYFSVHIINSCATGDIEVLHGETNAGALIGYFSTAHIVNAYATGTVLHSDATTGYFGAFIGRAESYVYINGGYYNTTINQGLSVIGNTRYTPDIFITKGFPDVAMKSSNFTDLLNFGTYSKNIQWQADESGYPLPVNEPAQILFSGQGTLDDPYLISTSTQLYGMAYLVNSIGSKYGEKHYRLTNDILLNDTTGWDARITSARWVQKAGTAHEDPADSLVLPQFDITDTYFYQWTPIAAESSFSGTFDGGGHTIYGLYIDDCLYYAGLFGKADWKSIIKNVNLDKAFVKSYFVRNNYYSQGNNVSAYAALPPQVHAGALVGKSAGNIEGCVSHAVVSAYYDNGSVYTGGLIGSTWDVAISHNYAEGHVAAYSAGYEAHCGGLVGKISGGSMTKCHANTHTISFSAYTAYSGGLAGTTTHLPVSNCFSAGRVQVLNSRRYNNDWNIAYAGGLTGLSEDTSVENSYTLADVHTLGGGVHAGGMLGHASWGEVSNSYSIGSVSQENNTAGYTGALIGCVEGEVEVHNVYYASTVNPALLPVGYGSMDQEDNVTGKTIDEIKSFNFVEQLNAEVEAHNSSTPPIRWAAWTLNQNRNEGYPCQGLPLKLLGTLTADNKPYDGTAHATFSFMLLALDGVQNGHEVKVNKNGIAGTFAASNAAPGIDVELDRSTLLTGIDVDHYILQAEFPAFTADITQAPLIITANDCEKLQGTVDPAYTATYSGFVANEDETILRGTLVFTREEGEVPGVYEVIPEGVTSENYHIIYEEGVLTINPVAGLPAVDTGGLLLYPNPAKDITTLSGLSENVPAVLTLYTLSGQHVVQWKTNANAIHSLTVDIYPNGFYLLEVVQDTKKTVLKLVVKR